MKKFLLSIIAGVGLLSVTAQTTIYVSASASGNNDGTSWADAYTDLQAALTAATTAGDEIWVAQGTYVPGTTANDEYVFPTTEIGLYGGFMGTETTRTGVRDPKLTVLSGDADGNGLLSAGDCYHIMNGNTSNVNSIIDGFSFTGGNSVSGFPDNVGGALWFDNGGVTVQNCNFISNVGRFGGAIFSYHCNMTLINCLFSDNHAIAGSGGAIDSEQSGNNLKVVNCTFYGNTASGNGEAISNFSSTSNNIVNSIFWGNGTSTTLLYNINSGDISNSLVQGGFIGAVNIIDADPMFNMSDSIDFSLGACSPAINMGDTTGLAYYNNMYDIAFNDRFVDNVDLGAFEFDLNNVVTKSSNTLTANANGDSLQYQWIKCSNNQLVSGANNKNFTPSTSGSYSVIVVTDDSCIVDTSDCVSVTISGIEQNLDKNVITIYPNPTNGFLSIDSNKGENINSISIFNLLGEELFVSESTTLDLTNLKNGVYYIRISMKNNEVVIKRVVKN